MLAVISPAKSLDYKSPHQPLPPSRPAFEADAVNLARAAAKMPAAKLGELMHISDSLAELNAERFRGFDGAPARPAIFAFAGDVYMGFEVKSLEEEAITELEWDEARHAAQAAYGRMATRQGKE